MDIVSLLLDKIEISRHFQTQIFYLFMLIFTVFAVYLSKRYKLFRFSMFLWLSVTIIGFIWEGSLFFFGLRHYSFFALAELMYHAITEGGPGLIIMAIFADKFGIIDLSEYKEDK
jgi:hypothetical protein